MNMRDLNARLMEHKDLMLSDEMFIIRPFRSLEEIQTEGRVLQHAVAYYAGYYAAGNDFLFVLRHVQNPDVPFATLEFSPKGDLLQACKWRNAFIKQGAEYEFIERFRKEVLLPFINQ